jgi:hypothetical protein
MNSEFTVGISLSPTSRLCFVTSGHCGTIINRVAGATRDFVEVTNDCARRIAIGLSDR